MFVVATNNSFHHTANATGMPFPRHRGVPGGAVELQRVEAPALEFLGESPYRRVAALAHLGHDVARGRLDVSGHRRGARRKAGQAGAVLRISGRNHGQLGSGHCDPPG